MSTEIKIPSVGESISSGVIATWHQQNGGFVKKGDLLFTLETDKVSQEITAEEEGKLEIKAAEGDEVQIGQVVGLIDTSASAPAGDAAPAAPAPAASESAASAPKEEKKETAAPKPVSEAVEQQSPAVRRIMTEQSVSPADVEGTGKDARITKEDVLEFLKNRPEAPAAEVKGEVVDAPALKVASAPAPDDDATPYTTRKRLSPLRRKIAEQLVSVQQTSAILTTFNECDMSSVKNLRARMQDGFQKRHGIKLGFMSFFIKAAVRALQEVPAINGRIDGEDFVQNHFYDIGVAVGTEKGLVVPVIRGADRKSFAEIEQDILDYGQKAREGKIKIDDLRGGVFTISNGGVYGSLMSTPILNPPQSGILGMHSIQDRPVAIKGQVEIRPMMYLALSYDHRAVDGKEAVTFLVKIKEAIEDPMLLVL